MIWKVDDLPYLRVPTQNMPKNSTEHKNFQSKQVIPYFLAHKTYWPLRRIMIIFIRNFRKKKK
jgi:hypothetical protein